MQHKACFVEWDQTSKEGTVQHQEKHHFYESWSQDML